MSDDLLRDPVSRRAFLARMTRGRAWHGGGGPAGRLRRRRQQRQRQQSSAPAATRLTTFADPANFPGVPGQNENLVVLNFALTLETLEADLYRQALNVAAGQPSPRPCPRPMPMPTRWPPPPAG